MSNNEFAAVTSDELADRLVFLQTVMIPHATGERLAHLQTRWTLIRREMDARLTAALAEIL